MTVEMMLEAGQTLEQVLGAVRRHAVTVTVKHESGHCQRAAAKLGIHRNTVTRILAECGTPQTTGRKRRAA
jgi:DNA-binding NtrC family response regulator